MELKNCWTLYNEEQLQELEKMSASYIDFLNKGKTEREVVAYIKKWAADRGFKNLEDVIAKNQELKPGDRIIVTHMKKTCGLFIVGKKPLVDGLTFIGSHIDSPRIDLKQKPFYEDKGLAYWDTHYYGGIKKYQWVTIPLAVHGVVCKMDGETVNITIGEDPTDPIVLITDLLPHLAQEQMEKGAAKVIEGENLDVLIGSRPLDGEVKDPAKAFILKILKDKYQIEEEDFLSAEIEIVPAGATREAGLDRSMIMGYGQDDRSCAYPSLYAMEELLKDADAGRYPEHTCIAFFADKEEIGSVGATGSHSRFFENSVAELCALDPQSKEIRLELCIRRCLMNTKVLSADVASAYDPLYGSAYSRNNASQLGYGITIVKYTGARGKSSANDANAEYLAKIRQLFDQEKIAFQTAELGRVDLGGGGTIAYIVAEYGCSVVDCGIPVLSMHAPMEVISKADLYETYRAYLAFFRYM